MNGAEGRFGVGGEQGEDGGWTDGGEGWGGEQSVGAGGPGARLSGNSTSGSSEGALWAGGCGAVSRYSSRAARMRGSAGRWEGSGLRQRFIQ